LPWGWFDQKRNDSSAEWTGFLEQGVRLEGKLESSGTFRIDSAVRGKLVSQESLILGDNAAVEGEIDATNVIMAGRFDGIVRATKRVEIRARAIVTGEVHSPCIVIEPGAIFEGQLHLPIRADDSQPVVVSIRSAATRS
jgi:cytoskeletal protein CcmA (bactofilin family)